MTRTRRLLTLIVLGCGLVAAPAAAQESMRFEPVPEESVRALDRRMRRTRTTTTVQAAPAAPAAPAPGASTPTPPEPPENVTMRFGDVMRIASDIHIEKDQVVDGDVVAMGGDVKVDGHVKGNVVATGGDVELGPTSRVDGDVMCLGGELREADGASVGGQRVTAMHGREREAMRKRIRDRVRDRLEMEDIHIGGDFGEKIGDFVGAIMWTLVWLGIAWVIIHFAPQRTATALETLKREPGMSLAIGFLTVLLLVPSVVALALVVAVLCITIIGIPVAIGVLLAYFALLLLIAVWGAVIGVMPVGERLIAGRGQPTMLRAALFGVLAIDGLLVLANAFDLIPFMGWVSGFVGFTWWVVGTLLLLVGAGALLRSKFGLGPEGRWWPIRPAGPPAATMSGPAGPAPSPPVTPPAGAPVSYAPEPPEPPAPPAPAPSS